MCAACLLPLEGPALGEDTAEEVLGADITSLLLNRCVCWSRAKIFMQIIKRYEMLITYKPPNESFK